MAALHSYLASLPAEGTVVVSVLCVAAPVVALLFSGFAFFHAAEVAAARSWGR